VAIVINGRDFVINKSMLRTISLRNDIIDDIGDPAVVLHTIHDSHLPADSWFSRSVWMTHRQGTPTIWNGTTLRQLRYRPTKMAEKTDSSERS
jgi:hypothetical protein